MEMKQLHPLIPEMHEELSKGRISRREFLRFSTLLGLSLASAEILAACAEPFQTPAPTAATIAPTKPAQGLTHPRRRDPLRHPARTSRSPGAFHSSPASRMPGDTCWNTSPTPIQKASPRLTCWKNGRPATDLKTWTLSVRKGIRFNNGQELTAEDVIFNFEQWLNPKTGSHPWQAACPTWRLPA